MKGLRDFNLARKDSASHPTTRRTLCDALVFITETKVNSAIDADQRVTRQDQCGMREQNPIYRDSFREERSASEKYGTRQ